MSGIDNHPLARAKRTAAAALLGAAALPGLATDVLAQAQKDSAAAAPAAKAADSPETGDTRITAASIEYDLDKRQYVLDKDAEIISPNSHIRSDRMTVRLTPDRELEWAKCEGKVLLEKKNADGTTVDARCQVLEDFETTKKATLTGDVVIHQTSARLAKPATITGHRVELDMATRVNIVRGNSSAQAKVHLEPKGPEPVAGKPAAPAPEPADLIGDTIKVNDVTQEYWAEGKPVLVRPSSKLQAKRIRFQVEDVKDPSGGGAARKEVKLAYADEDVVYDAVNEKGSVTHATGDHGVYNKELSELVMTGNVYATTKDPQDDAPTVYQGDKFVHNSKTGIGNLSTVAGGSPRVFLNLPPGKTQKKSDVPESADAAPGDIRKGDVRKPEKKGEPKKTDVKGDSK